MVRLIIWGTGELGSRAARLWLQNGGTVLGFTQSDARHSDLKALGVEPHRGNPQQFLQPDDRLLLALPGHQTQLSAIQMLAQANTPPPARTVLISLTGYYGSEPRGVINEDSPPGEDKRAQSIAATEVSFLQWANHKGVILRLGGLYTLNRGPMHALARRGSPLIRPPDKTLALIHYDDAAAATAAALQHPAPENIYLTVTPPCPTRKEFYTLACARLHLPPPQFDAPLGHPPAEYDVTHLRRDLLPNPAYPDWREALEI